MKKILLLLLILLGRFFSIAEPSGCAGPAMSGNFILVDKPINVSKKTNEKIGVIYRFQIEKGNKYFDVFIDLNKYWNIKFVQGETYEISILHNCKDNAHGYKLLFGQDRDHGILAMFIRKRKKPNHKNRK